MRINLLFFCFILSSQFFFNQIIASPSTSNNEPVLPPPMENVFSCDIGNPLISHSSNFAVAFQSDAAADAQLADDFTFTNDVIVNQVCWYGMYVTANIPDDFTITYYEDNAGTVGDEIASFPSVTLTKKEITGNLINNVRTEYGYSASHPDLLFPLGTYWISIQNNTPDFPGNNWYWSTSSDGNSIDAFRVVSPQWQLSSGSDSAFILGNNTPIPTLSQWGITALLLILLISGIIGLKQKRTIIYNS